MIQLQNIHKTYETPSGKLHALRNINLHVPRGKIFGVIGKSGAGKSTLIRSVNLLETPTEGKVLIDQEDITNLSQHELREVRRQTGMIFQHFNLLSRRTVYENVAFPLELIGKSKEEIHAKVTSLLSLVELSSKADVYPANLSGGQKQRVAIARALASDPKVLLCDEATSSLDPETTQSILQLLKNINKKLGLTILLITHEMDVIKEICDHVAVIDHGEIVEEANIVEFFTKPKTDLAKNIVKNCLKHDLPLEIQAALSPTEFPNSCAVLRIIFHGHAAAEPLVAQLMEHFQIKLNILQANIEIIKSETIGIMVAEVFDTNKQLSKAIEFLKSKNVSAEVIGYVKPAII